MFEAIIAVASVRLATMSNSGRGAVDSFALARATVTVASGQLVVVIPRRLRSSSAVGSEVLRSPPSQRPGVVTCACLIQALRAVAIAAGLIGVSHGRHQGTEKG